MRNLLIVALLLAFAACASPAPKEVPAAAAEAPKPITINAPGAPVAEIDPVTLKVTYRKGADVKAFADQIVQAWAQTSKELQACQNELKKGK